MSEVRVLKFGGSSLASAQHIHRVAEIVEEHFNACGKVVVVVSAMGKGTDQFISLAEEVSAQAKSKHRRELDMLVSVGERISMSLLTMAIRDRGIAALSLTGSQSGIITTESHGEAEIVEIRGERILKALEEKKVVIVAGFQGVSREKEITTLGRGGSDTTALALAVYLKANCARIYSDVDAYYSADPKLVPTALRHPEISWELGFLSSFYGAKVLHHRAAEIAAKNQLEIQLLSTSNPHGKTGYLRGGVNDNSNKFQLFTLNLKKGLQKLTTKNVSALDKRYQSELKGLISPPFYGIIPGTTDKALNEIFVHSDEKLFGDQEGKENISSNETEYWALSLVGTALNSAKSPMKSAEEIFSSLGIMLLAKKEAAHIHCFTFKALPHEKEIELLFRFHKHFFEKHD